MLKPNTASNAKVTRKWNQLAKSEKKAVVIWMKYMHRNPTDAGRRSLKRHTVDLRTDGSIRIRLWTPTMDVFEPVVIKPKTVTLTNREWDRAYAFAFADRHGL